MLKKKGVRIIKLLVSTVLVVSIVTYVYNWLVAETVSVKSSIDGKRYLVQNKPDKQAAADQLANMCIKLNKFTEILKAEYPDDERIIRLTNNFKCHNVTEGDGAFGYTSYVQNKQDVVMCMRDAQTGALHRENLLIFVAIHEMSHIMSESYGHNEEFKVNFGFLIEEAEARGVYSHENFSSNPKAFCGLMVTATPH